MAVICLLAGCDKPLPTVTSIRIVPGSLDLNVGDSAPLSASIEPAEASNGAFNWSSDDSSIASVDQSGKVTALKEGTTTIKATLVDGQGKPYAYQSVTFNINGVFYNRLTDSFGTAKLNINLMPGEYIITSMYNGMAIANTITIKD